MRSPVLEYRFIRVYAFCPTMILLRPSHEDQVKAAVIGACAVDLGVESD